MDELPEDILIDILCRFPVKSLWTFKTVCKSWCSIISSTMFVKKHLNHTHSIRYNQHKDLLGILIPSQKSSKHCVLYNQNPDGIIYAKRFDFPFHGVQVCNYCDGLICFNMSGHSILLWNPSFPMEHKIIPMEYKAEIPSKLNKFYVGMGYDSASDDYKIVRVPKSSNWGLLSTHQSLGEYSFVEVFSQKSHSWNKREIPKNFTYDILQKRSVYSRNRLHWIGRRYDGYKGKQLIVYFDMVKERLDYLNLPCRFEKMLNYKDSLAITSKNTLWCLLDYDGMKSLWTKFQLAESVSSCFTRKYEILIQPRGHGLATLDTEDEDGLMRQRWFLYHKSSLAWFYVSPYLESLVSPRWFD